MATQARFGRLPRSAPSLTSTIVALAQEYARVRESNMIDAWKNGGEFEGHKVTDKMLMGWLKDRRNELSPDDPKWDYYDNQITQYEFAIENSKMELKYKQGDVSDGGMAQFYHKWASKLPKDSEAYREREKLAAGYADRAASAGRASSAAARDKAYANEINKSYKKEFVYDAQLAFLTNEAMNRGILRDNESLANIDPNTADGREINRLWDEIAHSPEYADERAFYTEQIKKHGDPSFNGDFSQDAFNAQTGVKNAAVNDRIGAARKAGRETDVTAFQKDKAQVRGTKVITSGFDETEMYEDSRATWLKTFQNPNATPLEIDRANTAYIADLEKIRAGLESSKKPGEVDPRLGYLSNELRTMHGDEAPLEHWGGSVGPGGNTGLSNATETAQGINRLKTEVTNLSLRDANGEPLFVLTKMFNGEPVATNDQNHAAASWGVADRRTMPPDTVYVVQNDYGDPRAGKVVTAVTPTPIHVVSDIRDPTTGEVRPKTSDTPAAFHYTLPDGKTGYKFQDADGNWLYTYSNPFASVKTNPDGTTTEAENPITVSAKQATVNVPGNGITVPGASTSIAERYYNPAANKAMTSTVAKSGYSLWLMAADPKDNSAYTAKPEDIITSLSLEAGGDPKKLAELVIEADQRRAVYLGNSTEEQQRQRRNALTGTPNPVSLASVMTKMGIEGPSAEQRAIDSLTGGTRDSISDDMREANRLGLKPATGGGMIGPPTPLDNTDLLLRKYNMVPTPPKPAAAGPTPAQTSMGSDLPGDIAKNLGNFFGGLFGNPVVPPKVNAPKPMGPPTPYNTAPTPSGAPKPVAPPPKPAPAPAPPPTPSTPKPPSTPQPFSAMPRHEIRDSKGNLIGVSQGGRTMM